MALPFNDHGYDETDENTMFCSWEDFKALALDSVYFLRSDHDVSSVDDDIFEYVEEYTEHALTLIKAEHVEYVNTYGVGLVGNDYVSDMAETIAYELENNTDQLGGFAGFDVDTDDVWQNFPHEVQEGFSESGQDIDDISDAIDIGVHAFLDHSARGIVYDLVYSVRDELFVTLDTPELFTHDRDNVDKIR